MTPWSMNIQPNTSPILSAFYPAGMSKPVYLRCYLMLKRYVDQHTPKLQTPITLPFFPSKYPETIHATVLFKALNTVSYEEVSTEDTPETSKLTYAAVKDSYLLIVLLCVQHHLMPILTPLPCILGIITPLSWEKVSNAIAMHTKKALDVYSEEPQSHLLFTLQTPNPRAQ
jgi:hypothetical protein